MNRSIAVPAVSAAALVLGAGGVLATLGLSGSPPADATAASVEPVGLTESLAEAVYEVDNLHSTVLFRIRHGGHGFFWGRFNTGEGRFFIDEENPSNSFFEATIDVASVDTNDGEGDRRDQHIRAADFLNARQFRTATFKSTSFTPTDEPNVYELKGDFTLVGETRPITARVEYGGKGTFQRKEIQGFEATFEFKRSDFGLTTYLAPDGGEGGGLGNTIKMVIGVEGIKQ